MYQIIVDLTIGSFVLTATYSTLHNALAGAGRAVRHPECYKAAVIRSTGKVIFTINKGSKNYLA
jgi:hypothetical protein